MRVTTQRRVRVEMSEDEALRLYHALAECVEVLSGESEDLDDSVLAVAQLARLLGIELTEEPGETSFKAEGESAAPEE